MGPCCYMRSTVLVYSEVGTMAMVVDHSRGQHLPMAWRRKACGLVPLLIRG